MADRSVEDEVDYEMEDGGRAQDVPADPADDSQAMAVSEEAMSQTADAGSQGQNEMRFERDETADGERQDGRYMRVPADEHVTMLAEKKSPFEVDEHDENVALKKKVAALKQEVETLRKNKTDHGSNSCPLGMRSTPLPPYQTPRMGYGYGVPATPLGNGRWLPARGAYALPATRPGKKAVAPSPTRVRAVAAHGSSARMQPAEVMPWQLTGVIPPPGTPRALSWPAIDGREGMDPHGPDDPQFHKIFASRAKDLNFREGMDFYDWMTEVTEIMNASLTTGNTNTRQCWEAIRPLFPAQVRAMLQPSQNRPRGAYNYDHHDWPIDSTSDLFAWGANLMVTPAMVFEAENAFKRPTWGRHPGPNGTLVDDSITFVTGAIRASFLRWDSYQIAGMKITDERAAQLMQRDSLAHVIGEENWRLLKGMCDNADIGLASFDALASRAKAMDMTPRPDTPRGKPLAGNVASQHVPGPTTAPVLNAMIAAPPPNGSSGQLHSGQTYGAQNAHPNAGGGGGGKWYFGNRTWRNPDGPYGHGGFPGNGQRGGAGRPGPYSKTCFNCRGFGHDAANCPSPPSERQKRYLARRAAKGQTPGAPNGNVGQSGPPPPGGHGEAPTMSGNVGQHEVVFVKGCGLPTDVRSASSTGLTGVVRNPDAPRDENTAKIVEGRSLNRVASPHANHSSCVSGSNAEPLGQRPVPVVLPAAVPTIGPMTLHKNADDLPTHEPSAELSERSDMATLPTVEPESDVSSLNLTQNEESLGINVQYHTADVGAVVGGVSAHALLDSGANFEGMSQQFWSEKIAHSTDYERRAEAGSYAVVLGTGVTSYSRGRVNMPVVVENGPAVWRWFHIIPGLQREIVLGTGWHRQSGALIDWKQKTLQFPIGPNAEVQTKSYSAPITLNVETRDEPLDPYVATLALTENVVVPKEASIDVKLMVVATPVDHSQLAGQDVFVQSSPLYAARDGLMVAKGVQTFEPDGKTMWLKLTNWTAKDMFVMKGARVAHFEAFDKNQYMLLETQKRLSNVAEVEVVRFTPDGTELPPATNLAIAPEPATQASAATQSKPSGEDLGIPGLDFSKTVLRDDQLKMLADLLRENKDIFSIGDVPGVVKGVQHQIDTGDVRPIKAPMFRTSPRDREVITTHVQKMVQDGIVQPSDSDWSAPVLMVPKKDGKLRFCVDYRKLNAITKKDVYPLPRIDDLLDASHGAMFFSTLDITWGYWNIEIDPKDRKKTAFRTPIGLHEFIRMPFGLTNAPATFQRLMDAVMRGIAWDYALVYIDDIMIFSRTFEEHLKHLEEVFRRIRTANLKVRAAKCTFCHAETMYLGHVITRDGFIKMDPKKIAAVRDYPMPRTLRELQAFLGLTGYYRHFIAKYAHIVAPLTDMTVEGAVVDLTSGPAHEAFLKIKERMCSDPVLRRVDFNKPFYLQTDASKYALGAILCQRDEDGRDYAVGFGSKRLTPAERKWDTRTQEAFATIWGCEYFRHYLLGAPFVLQTDHESLKMLKDPNSTGKIARWAIRLTEFDFRPVHKPGKKHANVDALSRIELPGDEMEVDDTIPTYGDQRPDATVPPKLSLSLAESRQVVFTLRPGLLTTCENFEAAKQLQLNVMQTAEAAQHALNTAADVENVAEQTTFGISFDDEAYRRQMIEDQMNDDHLGRIIEVLTGKVPQGKANDRAYVAARDASQEMAMINGFLMRVAMKNVPTIGQNAQADGEAPAQLVVPRTRREGILRSCHEDRMAAHQGTAAMLRRLTGRYYWPGMARDVREWVGSCVSCQGRKPPLQKRNGLLQPFDFSVTQPWEDIAVDHAGPFPKSDRGDVYILVIIDMFTRFAEAVPVPDATALTTALAIYNHWICRYGLFRRLHSDRGTAFDNYVMKALALRLGFEHTFTSPKHPQGNPYAERFMKPLVDALTAYVNDQKQTDWDLALPSIMFAYVTRVHSTTMDTPFFWAMGRDPRMPTDVMSGLSDRRRHYDEELPISSMLSKAYEALRTRLEKSAEKRKLIYDANQLDKHFAPENIVMVHADEPYREGASTKFNSRWIGPYRIVEEISPVTYKVRHLHTAEETMAHVQRLRKIVAQPRLLSEAMAAPYVRPSPVTYDLSGPPVVAPIEEGLEPAGVNLAGDLMFDMQAVLDKHVDGPIVQYLVKLRGYREPRWFLEENVHGNALVDAYERDHPTGKGGKAISKRSRLSAMKARLAERRKAVGMVPYAPEPPTKKRKRATKPTSSAAKKGKKASASVEKKNAASTMAASTPSPQGKRPQLRSGLRRRDGSA